MTSLAEVESGPALCVDIEGEGPEVARLKRLGIGVDRHVVVVQQGDPMIIEVVGARFGLSRRLARRVAVERVTVDHVADAATDEQSRGEA